MRSTAAEFDLWQGASIAVKDKQSNASQAPLQSEILKPISGSAVKNSGPGSHGTLSGDSSVGSPVNSPRSTRMAIEEIVEFEVFDAYKARSSQVALLLFSLSLVLNR